VGSSTPKSEASTSSSAAASNEEVEVEVELEPVPVVVELCARTEKEIKNKKASKAGKIITFLLAIPFNNYLRFLLLVERELGFDL
jgi:hypothetical protein